MDGYEKVTVIGSGPLGLTYKLRSKKIAGSLKENDTVACKVISKVDEPSGQIRTILEEAIVFGPTYHTNIATCFELHHDRTSDMFYFIQEYFPSTLHNLLIKCQRTNTYIQEDVFWEVTAQVVQAVAFLHSSEGKAVRNCNYEPLVVHQLVHSNLKPSNIGITPSGRVKLMDNRIRQPIGAYLEKCSDMSLHYYTAPELYDSEDNWTAAVDLWSIGCIAYHIVALMPPFQAAMLNQILAKQRSGEYPPIPSQYSQDVSAFIASLLVLDPTKRPSVLELSMQPRISEALKRLSNSARPLLAAMMT